jgi:hypothetical protein
MRLALVLALLLMGGCALMYQPNNIEEAVKLIKAQEGSGCVYIRGNARPYADVSMLQVHAYGKGAPKYDECLRAIPDNARSLLGP